MAIFNIPVVAGAGNSNYQIEVTLDGVAFVLAFRYNGRMDSWVVDLRDRTGAVIQSGVSLITGFTLFLRLQKRSKPQGSLIAVAVSDDTISAADLDQLSSEILLVYQGDT